jgi:translocator assembly and maintenance protein 41
VYFNPFVEWRDKRIKYGVVRMKDLAMDVLTWDRFYLSGRLQKPVHVLVDNWDIRKLNTINLEMATSASLLLLPEEFTEYDLYAQICSLSYMGDLRMLFAEDKDKVKKIVEGSFQSFQSMYRPLLQEYIAEGLLKRSSHGQQKTFQQVYYLSAHTHSLLPCSKRKL